MPDNPNPSTPSDEPKDPPEDQDWLEIENIRSGDPADGDPGE